MDEVEFDRFAAEYQEHHAANIRLSGEAPDFFAAYKIDDVRRCLEASGIVARRVLDLGAGVGNSLGPMLRAFPSSEITCLDVSSRSLAIAEARHPGQAEFVRFDGRTIPFADDHFDLIFTACVFHHIRKADHAPLLSEVRRVLSPDGNFFLFEHNPYNPLTVHAVNTCPFDANAELISAPAMRRTIRNAGFDNPKTAYRLFFPRALAILRPIERCLTRLPLGAQYYVHATKAAA